MSVYVKLRHTVKTMHVVKSYYYYSLRLDTHTPCYAGTYTTTHQKWLYVNDEVLYTPSIYYNIILYRHVVCSQYQASE